jgi:hypothetical protein
MHNHHTSWGMNEHAEGSPALGRGARPLFAPWVGEQNRVGTVFIASAVAVISGERPLWLGHGGRDEDGPYRGLSSGCKNMTPTPRPLL